VPWRGCLAVRAVGEGGRARAGKGRALGVGLEVGRGRGTGMSSRWEAVVVGGEGGDGGGGGRLYEIDTLGRRLNGNGTYSPSTWRHQPDKVVVLVDIDCLVKLLRY
jgi:hypothetical protein